MLPMHLIYCETKQFGGPVMPVYDIMPFAQLVIFIWCSFGFFHSTIHILPVFEPNDYLQEHFKHMGDEPWEIYAWAAREVIANHSGLQRCDLKNREKIDYEKFM